MWALTGKTQRERDRMGKGTDFPGREHSVEGHGTNTHRQAEDSVPGNDIKGENWIKS